MAKASLGHGRVLAIFGAAEACRSANPCLDEADGGGHPAWPRVHRAGGGVDREEARHGWFPSLAEDG